MRGNNSDEQNAYLLEQTNDRLVANELASKVSAIKNLTLSINEEMEDQNRLLDNMGESFDNTNSNFSSTAKYLDKVMKSANSRSCIYLSVGIIKLKKKFDVHYI
jgi:blocked-early-in-transport protein 1